MLTHDNPNDSPQPPKTSSNDDYPKKVAEDAAATQLRNQQAFETQQRNDAIQADQRRFGTI